MLMTKSRQRQMRGIMSRQNNRNKNAPRAANTPGNGSFEFGTQELRNPGAPGQNFLSF
jgi:hypothetical protein